MNPSMRRRILIDICLRRIRPGTGSIRLPIQWKPVMQLNFLPRPYVIVGGVATRAYMPFRETIDLDILIHSDEIISYGEQVGSRTSDVGIFHRVVYKCKLYEIATSNLGDRSVWWIGCAFSDDYFNQ